MLDEDDDSAFLIDVLCIHSSLEIFSAHGSSVLYAADTFDRSRMGVGNGSAIAVGTSFTSRFASIPTVVFISADFKFLTIRTGALRGERTARVGWVCNCFVDWNSTDNGFWFFFGGFLFFFLGTVGNFLALAGHPLNHVLNLGRHAFETFNAFSNIA